MTPPDHKLETVQYNPTELTTYHRNPRRGNIDAIAESLNTNGQYRAIVVNLGRQTGRPLEVLAGNHTLQAAIQLGWDTITATTIDVNDQQAARIVAADNRTADLGDYDTDQLTSLLKDLDGLDGTGYTDDDLTDLLDDLTDADMDPAPSLRDRFGAVPVTLLDSRAGDWQTRKRAWQATFGDSRLGRTAATYDTAITRYSNWGEVALRARRKDPTLTEAEIEKRYAAKLVGFKGGSGVSEFDPVLAEILTNWFTPPNGTIIDPWAGGIVRGAVAAMNGRTYTGIDLSADQIDANTEQLTRLPADVQDRIRYIHGDSTTALDALPAGSFDAAIGCPPYYGLEKYSDDPDDLSTMTPDEFDAEMERTLRALDRVLVQDSFISLVVGSVRDTRGDLLDMRLLLGNIARRIGWALANDAVLVTTYGSVRFTVSNTFPKGRALGRVTQDVLTFVKGDRKATARKYGADVAILDLPEPEMETTP